MILEERILRYQRLHSLHIFRICGIPVISEETEVLEQLLTNKLYQVSVIVS